jgi:hypothetical protein
MSRLDLHLPEHLMERIESECQEKEISPSKLVSELLIRKFSLQTPQDKLNLLRDLIKTKYAD